MQTEEQRVGARIAVRVWRGAVVFALLSVLFAGARAAWMATRPLFDAFDVIFPTAFGLVVLGLGDGVRRRSWLSLRWARQSALGGFVWSVVFPTMLLTGAWRVPEPAWSWIYFAFTAPSALFFVSQVYRPALGEHVHTRD